VKAVGQLRPRWGGALMSNVAARIGALASLGLATVFVARVGGPSAVGIYALLRVLPGLVGVMISAGLPGAIAYFLAGPTRDNPRLRLTLIGMGVVGGAAGSLLWVVAAPMLASSLFVGLSAGMVAWAGMTVFTQLVVATGKSCCQGSGDMAGANWVIFFEEFMFLPAYVGLWFLGVHGYGAMIGALVLADVLTALFAWVRLARRGFFAELERPSWRLAGTVANYGIRAQVGGVIGLLNLRLDFVILSALAGTTVLGVYAIASKFAELLKIPPMALTYVLYPRYARRQPHEAAAEARSLIPRAGIGVAFAAIPLGIAATFLLPVIYGEAFETAVRPAHILLIGLAAEGVAGVITAFLYGVGRPGLNSLALGAGLVFTVIFDLALIPRFGAVGAAWASTIAYLSSTLVLAICFWSVGRTLRSPNRATVAVGAITGPIRESQ
jgi:O-antigen/teichoic acid export membrane protein